MSMKSHLSFIGSCFSEFGKYGCASIPAAIITPFSAVAAAVGLPCAIVAALLCTPIVIVLIKLWLVSAAIYCLGVGIKAIAGLLPETDDPKTTVPVYII